MLTRIRIETYVDDLPDVEEELDRYELALVREMAGEEVIAQARRDIEGMVGEDEVTPESEEPFWAKVEFVLGAMRAEFGSDSVTRKMTEQTIREHEDGFIARRVVRYDADLDLAQDD